MAWNGVTDFKVVLHGISLDANGTVKVFVCALLNSELNLPLVNNLTHPPFHPPFRTQTASEVVARHVHWDEDSFPSFEPGSSARATNAMTDCGAKGDGAVLNMSPCVVALVFYRASSTPLSSIPLHCHSFHSTPSSRSRLTTSQLCKRA
jgi:hypothetical protein